MTNSIKLLNLVNAPVFALTYGRDGAFCSWNSALSGVTGIPESGAVGKTPVQVLGAGARRLSLSPEGVVHIPTFGTLIVERDGDILVGTLQDSEREAFLAMAAHDLRAPLRNVQFLAETALSETTRNPDLLAKISSVARHGLGLTTDMVACVQALGLGEMSKTQVRLRDLAERVVATLETRPSVECRDVTLLVEEPLVMVVLRNLLDNAVRHGKAAPRIKIEAGACDTGVEIRVLDNGKGFRESSLTFLSGGELRVESGYGLLGLRRLLHSRGSRLGVEPAETGKGSAVLVTLPGEILTDQVAIAS